MANLKSQIVHVCNRSIAGYTIFKYEDHIARFIAILEYYNSFDIKVSYSAAQRNKTPFLPNGLLTKKTLMICNYISYCIMPDHYHLLIEIQNQKTLSHYINVIENAYTRFFNKKNQRKGPLWQSRFRQKTIETNEQLLHVSRYIHLNPVTAQLVENPEEWKWSSYKELTTSNDIYLKHNIFSIKSMKNYIRFTKSNKDYQRKLGFIKKYKLE